jgi:ATP-dependent helicase/nuclease subunit A
MVGDIKQSIYAFRGATPDIFKKYRDTFVPLNDVKDASDEPKVVFLQNNFRSDSKILDFSNTLFSRLMNFDTQNYLEKDKLVYSRADDALLPVELVLLQEDKEKEESVECEFVADKIAELLQEGTYSPSDIAILARATNTLEEVKACLDKRGIPCDATGEKNFFDSWEVLSVTSFLKAVANPLDDVSLAAALTMAPFSFTPDELLEIRGFSPKTDFYFALSKASCADGALADKCRDFMNFLEQMQSFAAENSAERVMWKIIEDTELFSELEKLDNPKGRKNNVIYLYSQAQSFCKKGVVSLGGLCDFFESLANSKNVKGAKTKKENAVRLMTFHASKGLEFPVCFAMGLGKPLNKQDSFGKIVFSPFGPTFNLPYSETCTQLNSYLKKSAASLVKASLIDEELRNLYVTLTRAEKKLFVSAE